MTPGDVYGQLVVVGKSDSRASDGSPYWKFTCSDCGDENLRTWTELRRKRDRCWKSCRDRISDDSPIKSLHYNYVHGASNRSLEWGLSFDEFARMISLPCHYCGSEPMAVYKKEASRKGITYNGIDRVDNSIGYLQGNVVPCCKFCNMAKSRWGLDDFTAWLDRVRG